MIIATNDRPAGFPHRWAGLLALASFALLIALPGVASAQIGSITSATVVGTNVSVVGSGLQNPTKVTLGTLTLTGVTGNTGGTLVTAVLPSVPAQGSYLLVVTSTTPVVPSLCLSIQPASNWVCLNGGWLPPDNPAASGATGTGGITQAVAFVVVIGSNGATGSTGGTGLQGPQGVAGNTGAQGTTGATGIQGVQGIQGFIGPAGPTGAIGPTGTALALESASDIHFKDLTGLNPSAGLMSFTGLTGLKTASAEIFYLLSADDGNTQVVTEKGVIDLVATANGITCNIQPSVQLHLGTVNGGCGLSFFNPGSQEGVTIVDSVSFATPATIVHNRVWYRILNVSDPSITIRIE